MVNLPSATPLPGVSSFDHGSDGSVGLVEDGGGRVTPPRAATIRLPVWSE